MPKDSDKSSEPRLLYIVFLIFHLSILTKKLSKKKKQRKRVKIFSTWLNV
uniref:Uncharacterized protein n=1 Tax=Rhizophora mucronata TaxID=61149 RepID=A0A2P2K573_RHIMU